MKIKKFRLGVAWNLHEQCTAKVSAPIYEKVTSHMEQAVRKRIKDVPFMGTVDFTTRNRNVLRFAVADYKLET